MAIKKIAYHVDGWRQPLGYSCARVTELFAVMAAAICPDAKIKGPCYGSTGPIDRFTRDRPDRPSPNLADPSAETEITKFLRWSQPELMLFIAQSLKGCCSCRSTLKQEASQPSSAADTSGRAPATGRTNGSQDVQQQRGDWHVGRHGSARQLHHRPGPDYE